MVRHSARAEPRAHAHTAAQLLPEVAVGHGKEAEFGKLEVMVQVIFKEALERCDVLRPHPDAQPLEGGVVQLAGSHSSADFPEHAARTTRVRTPLSIVRTRGAS